MSNGRDGRIDVATDLGAAVAFGVVAGVALLGAGGIWNPAHGGDLHGIFVVRYEAAVRALFQEGRLPLWNPYEFGGLPLLGTGQAGSLYPPMWLPFAVLPTWGALQAFYILHYVILAFGCLSYVRWRGLGRSAGLLAAAIIAAGVFRGHAKGGLDHPAFIACVAWTPWILLTWERATVRPLPWIGALGIVSALQWYAGYPDFPLNMAVLLAIMAMLMAPGGFRPIVGRLTIAALGLALGAVLAAPQILPTYEAVGESGRIAHRGFEVLRGFHGVHRLDYLLVILQRRLGAAAPLIVWGLYARPRACLAWLGALVWTVFAVNWPLDLLYRIPPFASVRFPMSWSQYTPVFGGFLAAQGLAALQVSARRSARMAGLAMGLLAFAAGIYGVYEGPAHIRPHDDEHAVAARRAGPLRRLQRSLPNQPRVVMGKTARTGASLRHRIPSPLGYEPSVLPRRASRLLDSIGPGRATFWVPAWRHPELARLLGVGLVVAPHNLVGPMEAAGYREVRRFAGGDRVLYRKPVPRARIVHRAELAPDEVSSLRRTVDRTRDVEGSAVLEGTAMPRLAEPPTSARESAEIVVDEPEHLEIDARLATPGLLVVRDTAYPGWEAWVDGLPVPILRADHAFRAVALESGRHRTVFRYAPRSLRWGWFLGLIGLLATVGIFVAPRFARSARARDLRG